MHSADCTLLLTSTVHIQCTRETVTQCISANTCLSTAHAHDSVVVMCVLLWVFFAASGYQPVPLPESIPMTSRDIISSLNEHLLCVLREVKVRGEEVEGMREALERYQRKFSVIVHQQVSPSLPPSFLPSLYLTPSLHRSTSLYLSLPFLLSLPIPLFVSLLFRHPLSPISLPPSLPPSIPSFLPLPLSSPSLPPPPPSPPLSSLSPSPSSLSSPPPPQGILYQEYLDGKREWERERDKLHQQLREMEGVKEMEETCRQELKVSQSVGIAIVLRNTDGWA